MSCCVRKCQNMLDLLQIKKVQSQILQGGNKPKWSSGAAENALGSTYVFDRLQH